MNFSLDISLTMYVHTYLPGSNKNAFNFVVLLLSMPSEVINVDSKKLPCQKKNYEMPTITTQKHTIFF